MARRRGRSHRTQRTTVSLLANSPGRRIRSRSLSHGARVLRTRLRPTHPRKTLAHDVLRVCREILRNDRCVKFIRLAPPERERFVEGVKRVRSFEVRVGKSHPYYNRLTRTE